jgi:hypothetical protein
MEEYRPAQSIPEQKIYGDDERLWDRCTVTALFSRTADVPALIEQLQRNLQRDVCTSLPFQYEAGDMPSCLRYMLL